MKKIFFLLYSMNVGGVEKALLELVSLIPLDRYEVHVGLLKKEGGFLQFLPNEVIIHEIDCYSDFLLLLNDPPLRNIRIMFKKGMIKDALVYFLLYVLYKLSGSRYLLYKYILRNEPYFSERFDLAVSFAGPSIMIDYYVSKKVRASRKIGWIHFDISKIDIDKRAIKKLYRDYNAIFIVSQKGKEIFDVMFPELSKKTKLFYNVVSEKQIIYLARKGKSFIDRFDGKRILTVGRLSEEKGQKEAIKALKILIDKGYRVRWYFIGDGAIREDCKRLANEYGISDAVVLLGTQINPYGYMQDCDIYVQPSRHEGFCITLAEALCFKNPIVATDFTGANEQLRNRDNGIVVGMSSEEIANGIINVWEEGLSKNTQKSENVNLSEFLNLA